MIDMRKYASENFITVADVREGPLQMKIVDVREGKFDKPNLVFETSDILSLNATNRKTLVRAYGFTSNAWISKEIELFLGEVPVDNEPKEAVIVRPISPPLTTVEKTAAAAASSDMNDDIPFPGKKTR
jgi:hypothetical protein